MYENTLMTRLKSLYSDLTLSGEEAENLVSFMVDSIDDKVTVMRDLYYHDYAPVKVLNPSYTVKGGKRDIEAEIISVSEGYDAFIKKIGCQTSGVLNKHKAALNLFLNILALPEPYSRIMYMRYFKCFNMDEISKAMFISKSSCYRKHERGLYILNKALSASEEQ